MSACKIGYHGTKIIVITEFYLIDYDGIVFVNDWDNLPIKKGKKGISSI